MNQPITGKAAASSSATAARTKAASAEKPGAGLAASGPAIRPARPAAPRLANARARRDKDPAGQLGRAKGQGQQHDDLAPPTQPPTRRPARTAPGRQLQPERGARDGGREKEAPGGEQAGKTMPNNNRMPKTADMSAMVDLFLSMERYRLAPKKVAWDRKHAATCDCSGSTGIIKETSKKADAAIDEIDRRIRFFEGFHQLV